MRSSEKRRAALGLARGKTGKEDSLPSLPSFFSLAPHKVNAWKRLRKMRIPYRNGTYDLPTQVDVLITELRETHGGLGQLEGSYMTCVLYTVGLTTQYNVESVM